MVIDDVYGSTARCGAPMLGICARKGTFTLLLLFIQKNILYILLNKNILNLNRDPPF